jgi:hypothetical protein
MDASIEQTPNTKDSSYSALNNLSLLRDDNVEAVRTKTCSPNFNGIMLLHCMAVHWFTLQNVAGIQKLSTALIFTKSQTAETPECLHTMPTERVPICYTCGSATGRECSKQHRASRNDHTLVLVLHSQTKCVTQRVLTGYPTAGKSRPSPCNHHYQSRSLSFPCWCRQIFGTYSTPAHTLQHSPHCCLHIAPHVAWAQHHIPPTQAGSHPKCVHTVQLGGHHGACPSRACCPHTPPSCHDSAKSVACSAAATPNSHWCCCCCC